MTDMCTDNTERVCVIKRDGREVPFDRCRISNAILKAADDVDGLGADVAADLADEVCTHLFTSGHCKFHVEEIQDEVVSVLTGTHPKIAVAYEVYRQKRTTARELKSVVNKIVSDVVFVDAKDSNDKRENANINTDTTAGAMLKIGSNISKNFYMKNMINPIFVEMHQEGRIHIHK